MPASYPSTIRHKHFKPSSKLQAAKPEPSLKKPHDGSVSCPLKQVEEEAVVEEQVCSAVRIRIECDGGGSSNVSYKVTDPPHPDLAHDSGDRFCFAPSYEEAVIHFEHEHPEHITETTLELLYRRDGQRKILWRKTFAWSACPAQAKTRFDGSLVLDDQPYDFQENAGLDAVALGWPTGRRPALFPGEFVTAEHSPYQLRMSIKAKPGVRVENPCVWMYFDVRIEEMELSFCDPAYIDDVLPNTRLAENRALFDSLTDAGDNDNLNGALPAAGEVKKVYLPSHTFYKDTSELTDHTYYERYRALWGDGPVIPIFAKLKLRDSNGDAVLAPLGVGKVRVLWEWVDQAEANWPGGDANIATWIDNARNYQVAATPESPTGRNCHVDRGGKRGPGAATCFPQQNGKPPAGGVPAHDGSDQTFPFRVQPLNAPGSPFAATRKWCAFSEVWGEGALAGQTGVHFQPSRMAGDAYSLHAYVAYTTDHEMENVITPANIPAELHAETGTFQIWRELEIIKHWRMRTATAEGGILDLAAVRTKFARYYVNLKVPNAHVGGLGNWFAELTNVANGVALPDFIREAVDPTHHEVLIYLKDYDDWLARMRALHGPGDNALYNWANGRPNFTDASGNLVWSSWEINAGNNGVTPLMKPWPVAFEPHDATDQGGGVVAVNFPDFPARNINVTFEKPRKLAHRATDVSPGIRTQIKQAVSNAFGDHHRGIGEDNMCSYQHPRAAHTGAHTPLRVQLAARNNDGRHQTRIDNVRDTVREVLAEAFYDQSKNTYEYTIAKLGWGFILFNEVMETALTTEFGARAGLVAIQATDLSNKNLPAGKAFYANAAGDRALAACLVPDPHRRTFEHEIGHALFLNHTYHSQETSDPNRYHQRQNPSAGACIMNSAPTNACDDGCLFCAFCQVRLWGWSVLTVDPATGNTAAPRTLYYHEDYNQDPGAPGGPLLDPHSGAPHATNLL